MLETAYLDEAGKPHKIQGETLQEIASQLPEGFEKPLRVYEIQGWVYSRTGWGWRGIGAK